MTAQIFQIRDYRRKNATREMERSAEAMFQATWAPFFAWMGTMGSFDADLCARGLAIDTSPSEMNPGDCA